MANNQFGSGYLFIGNYCQHTNIPVYNQYFSIIFQTCWSNVLCLKTEECLSAVVRYATFICGPGAGQLTDQVHSFLFVSLRSLARSAYTRQKFNFQDKIPFGNDFLEKMYAFQIRIIRTPPRVTYCIYCI